MSRMGHGEHDTNGVLPEGGGERFDFGRPDAVELLGRDDQPLDATIGGRADDLVQAGIGVRRAVVHSEQRPDEGCVVDTVRALEQWVPDAATLAECSGEVMLDGRRARLVQTGVDRDLHAGGKLRTACGKANIGSIGDGGSEPGHRRDVPAQADRRPSSISR